MFGKSINKRLIGPVLWVFNIQYFVVQYVVAIRWETPFSITRNTISDLGNSVCANYSDRFVCSPLHNWMNISFILVGLTQSIGALYIYKMTKRSKLASLGFFFMILAGAGTILVGLFPENTVSVLHIIGAGLPFLLGNLAMMFIGKGIDFPTYFKILSYILGSIGLVALILFLTKNYLSIGSGGMERIVAYPQTIWMVWVGIYYLLKSNTQP